MTTAPFIGTLNFMHQFPEKPHETIAQEHPTIPLDEFLFSHLLNAQESVKEKHRGIFIDSITNSSKRVFSFVGDSLERVIGANHDQIEADHDTSQIPHTVSGGSSHQLETALSSATVAAGFLGKITRSWEKPQYPVVHGKRLPEELETSEEKEEWKIQEERFNRQRATEVRALKSLAFRYALGAAKAYFDAEAEGGDIQGVLIAHGVPEGAQDDFKREVIERLKRLPPEVFAATLQDLA